MPIPIEKGRSQKIARELKRLQMAQAETTKRVRRLLAKALIYAIEADNGAEGAAEQRDAYLDAAIDAGLAPDAIRTGAGMVRKIRNLIDREDAQSHALGLLLAAADLVAEFDPTEAQKITAIADGLDTSGDHGRWKQIATPYRKDPIV